jgi:hypothetical protein
MVPTNGTFGKAVARSTDGRATYKAGVAVVLQTTVSTVVFKT